MADTPATLESPESDDHLYLARPPDVPLTRPLLTGDVFENVTLPGSADPSLVVVLTHPCSMRKGTQLAERIVVAEAAPYQHVPRAAWTGHARVMPLPSLRDVDDHHACHFESLGVVPGDTLEQATRLACLTDHGINLLQQRFIFSLTRLVVPTKQLQAVCAAVFKEIELHEEWVIEALEAGTALDEAAADFNAWIRADDGTGTMRQARLAQPQSVAALTRAMRAAIQERYHAP